ncbi:hypothetical protein HBA54_04250 [Pelagibius litoralis]|uniref:Uncharacterized protein n=1 Tax=Pelagibius litoralis TaxID=374515 RepID=A0A967C3I8_9PROT|nr:hypothetical protein [Pelagibius litoralis]NIA67794.1 hypothetical protein [Pelagibius litoralis]
MTKRASLTPKQREAMYEAQDGFCGCGCKRAIYPDWCVAEHEWPVALGNTGKPDGLWHPHCASVKTNGTPATTYGSDRHEIAKARRLEKRRLVDSEKVCNGKALSDFSAQNDGFGRLTKRAKIRSRGFDKSLRKKMNGEVVRVDG